MVPLLENSIETLIEVLGKIADTEKSLEIYEYVIINKLAVWSY